MAEPTVPVREMVDLIVDQWNRGLEAHEALRLLLPLTYRVLNAEPTSLTTMVAPYSMGSQDAPYEASEEVWAVGHDREPRQWFVNQRGTWIEAGPDPEPTPPVQQAWHGDDATELRADDAKPARQTMVPGPLSEGQRRRNQGAATHALASGRISVEEVGAVVKGLHDASVYRVQPEVPGE